MSAVIIPPPPATGDDAASQCKSLNKIPGLYTQLQECANTTELNRMKSFVDDTNNPNADFQSMSAIYGDLLLSGDSILGASPDQSTLDQVRMRNEDLKDRKVKLEANSNTNIAIIERTDRDFIDAKDQLPDTLAQKTVHVLDDYTLVVLSVAYIFFILTMMYWYIQQNNFAGSAIGMALVGALFAVAFGLILVTNFL